MIKFQIILLILFKKRIICDMILDMTDTSFRDYVSKIIIQVSVIF